MKFIVSVFLAMLTMLAVSAQVERKPLTVEFKEAAKPKEKESRSDLFKQLDLSKEQRNKLKEIRHAHTSAKAPIVNNSQLSEAGKKKQLRTLQKEQAEKLKAILTPEQQEKLRSSRQNNP